MFVRHARIKHLFCLLNSERQLLSKKRKKPVGLNLRFCYSSKLSLRRNGIWQVFDGAGDVTRTHDLMQYCPQGKLRITRSRRFGNKKDLPLGRSFDGAGDVTRTHDLMQYCPQGKLRITRQRGFGNKKRPTVW